MLPDQQRPVHPPLKLLPLACPLMSVVVNPEQLSFEMTEYVTVAKQTPGFGPTVLFAGQVIVGKILSAIVMVDEQVVVDPEASVIR